MNTMVHVNDSNKYMKISHTIWPSIITNIRGDRLACVQTLVTGEELEAL